MGRSNNISIRFYIKALSLRTIFVLLFVITFLFGNLLPKRVFSIEEDSGLYVTPIAIYTGENTPQEFCQINRYPESIEKYLEEYNPSNESFQDYYLIITNIKANKPYQIKVYNISETDKTIDLYLKYAQNDILLLTPEGTYYYCIWRMNGKYNSQEINIYVEPNNEKFKLKDNYIYQMINNELIIIKYLGEEEEITIPEIVDGYKVTGIENYAFQYNNIKKIFLSKYIKAIKDYAFYTTSITGIFVDEKNTYFTDIDGILFSKDYKQLVKYPASRKNETYIIPDKVEIITEDAFYKNKHLKQITFPASVIIFRIPYIIVPNDNKYLKLIVESNSEAEKFAVKYEYMYEVINYRE